MLYIALEEPLNQTNTNTEYQNSSLIIKRVNPERGIPTIFEFFTFSMRSVYVLLILGKVRKSV